MDVGDKEAEHNMMMGKKDCTSKTSSSSFVKVHNVLEAQMCKGCSWRRLHTEPTSGEIPIAVVRILKQAQKSPFLLFAQILR